MNGGIEMTCRGKLSSQGEKSSPEYLHLSYETLLRLLGASAGRLLAEVYEICENV